MSFPEITRVEMPNGTTAQLIAYAAGPEMEFAEILHAVPGGGPPMRERVFRAVPPPEPTPSPSPEPADEAANATEAS